MATEDIVRQGIAHAPEGRGTFVQLTVEENLRLGAYGRREPADLSEDFERVYGHFPVLDDAGARWPARCPAASSRCWPSPEP